MSEWYRAAYRPPSKLTPPEWMAKNVRISNSERSAFFDIEQTPWWREPLELAADNSVHEIVVMAPTGSGKSTIAEGLCPYIVAEDPGPFLYASQTDPDAKFWVESRAMPAMKSCEALKHLWPQDRSKARKTEIIWPHMPMLFGGANMSNFQEKSIRWGYGDEVWAWNPGLVREFLGRHHNRWNRRFYLVSQGGYEGDELSQEFAKTDRAEWSWQCQECHEFHAYDRSQRKYDRIKGEDGAIDQQASADTTRLVCPSCEHEYPDNPLNRRTLTNSAKYISAGGGLNGYRGFHVHAFAIWWIPWREYVLEELQAKAQLQAGDVTRWRQLTQKRDARPWDENMAIERKSVLKSQRTKEEIEKNPKAKLPGETHRFMTIDKGGDHFWAVIRAWSKGQWSTMLWEGYIPGKGGKEPEIRAIQEKFGVLDAHVFMDVSFEMPETLQLCSDNDWTGIRGEDRDFFAWDQKGNTKASERLYSRVNRKSQASRGGQNRWIGIAANPVRDILWRLVNRQGMPFEVLPDASKAYHAHMKAEVREPFKTAGSTRTKYKWTNRKHKANHLWDGEVYQVAAALMFHLFEGSESVDPPEK